MTTDQIGGGGTLKSPTEGRPRKSKRHPPTRAVPDVAAPQKPYHIKYIPSKIPGNAEIDAEIGDVMGLLIQLKKNWFLVGLVLSILLAKLEPSIGRKGGILVPEITIKYFAVSLIFLNSGLSLKTEELKHALTQVHLHTFIQCFTMMFIPVFMQFVSLVAMNHSLLQPLLINGFIVVSCMPPPVSSAVILTKTVGGNEAAAIFNSALGSLLGIFVSPVLILMTLGLSGDVPFLRIFIQLCGTVLLPLTIGQWLRGKIITWMEEKKPPFGTVASCTLLLIIYSAFCDTFSNSDISLPPVELFTVVAMVIACQLTLLYTTFLLSNSSWCQFRRQDTIAVMYCATHKSLTLAKGTLILADGVAFFRAGPPPHFGLSLKTEELKHALTQVHLHTFIQCFTMMFIPVFMQFVSLVAMNHNLLQPLLINGFIVVSCMPPPVSSAVILTKTVGGNEAAAIFNSALGSLLGIFVSPVLILMTLGLSGDVPFLRIFIQLCGTVLVPLTIGQWLRGKIITWMEEKKPPFGTVASCTLLLIIYSAFCDTFSNSDISLPPVELFTVVAMVIACQLTLLYTTFLLSNSSWCQFRRQDTIAVMYCATHKSLTLGIPMLKIIVSRQSSRTAVTFVRLRDPARGARVTKVTKLPQCPRLKSIN
eukprot:sb/3462879/